MLTRWICKDKDKYQAYKDQDKDKDQTCKDKDKDLTHKDQDKDFTYSYLLQVAAVQLTILQLQTYNRCYATTMNTK